MPVMIVCFFGVTGWPQGSAACCPAPSSRHASPPRYVHSKNRDNLPYKLVLNHLADRTPAEMAVLRGRLKSGAPNNGQPFPSEGYTGLILPESLDWRLYGEWVVMWLLLGRKLRPDGAFPPASLSTPRCYS